MSVRILGWICAAIFAGCGLVGLLASVLNWQWFFTSRGVRTAIGRLRRPWQRAIYGILSIAMLAMAYDIVATVNRLWS